MLYNFFSPYVVKYCALELEDFSLRGKNPFFLISIAIEVSWAYFVSEFLQAGYQLKSYENSAAEQIFVEHSKREKPWKYSKVFPGRILVTFAKMIFKKFFSYMWLLITTAVNYDGS